MRDRESQFVCSNLVCLCLVCFLSRSVFVLLFLSYLFTGSRPRVFALLSNELFLSSLTCAQGWLCRLVPGLLLVSILSLQQALWLVGWWEQALLWMLCEHQICSLQSHRLEHCCLVQRGLRSPGSSLTQPGLQGIPGCPLHSSLSLCRGPYLDRRKAFPHNLLTQCLASSCFTGFVAWLLALYKNEKSLPAIPSQLCKIYFFFFSLS